MEGRAADSRNAKSTNQDHETPTLHRAYVSVTKPTAKALKATSGPQDCVAGSAR